MVEPDEQDRGAEPEQKAASRHRRERLQEIKEWFCRGIGWPRRWWRGGDHIRRTANATALLAVGTLLLAAVNVGMLIEMRHASRDTQKAINATNRFAQAAEDYAAQAKRSANSADETVKLIRENFISDERPYIWLTTDHGNPELVANRAGSYQVIWTWHFQNFGKSPALNLKG